MLENEPTDTIETTDTTDGTDPGTTPGDSAITPPRRRRAASRPAGPPAVAAPPAEVAARTVDDRGAASDQGSKSPGEASVPGAALEAGPDTPRRRARKAVTSVETDGVVQGAQTSDTRAGAAPADSAAEPVGAGAPRRRARKAAAPAFSAPLEPSVAAAAEEISASAAALLFMAPPAGAAGHTGDPADDADDAGEADDADDADDAPGAGDAEPVDGDQDVIVGADGVRRKRRRRGGRGRRRRPDAGSDADGGAEGGSGESGTPGDVDDVEPTAGAGAVGDGGDGSGGGDGGDGGDEGTATRRRRRRRRKSGSGDAEGAEDTDGTVVHVREPREPRSRGGRATGDEVTAVRGSTRLEAKKQRRREGRDAGRRRPPILSEAEFLSRREAVNRVMVIRQRGDLTQIAVLEDGVLVEHYVASASSSTMQGNVYLGKVQNVLPSMEAAFIDIGRGRNAVLYAGEVNWDAAALDGQPRRIEHVMKSGDAVLAQVTKDPLGQKGSRLTSNISLAGRFLVYVPDGSMSGISRKLPDNERNRLKAILKNVVPEDAGVIVRTAAEGATEEQLTHDVQRLQAQWEEITKKAKTASAPSLLYGEPDLTVRVVRDLFNEDFDQLVVSGEDAWQVVESYVMNVAPDLMDRVSRHAGTRDAFAEYRIDEQIAKGLDRKVYLPSGGSLVIDRTEAMTVVDVNTGKFVGKGSGNLEETVTRNNLEAAEEIVRQLRLRDIGGIIVVDFIDMVLESNRELVLRRLTECLGRDRTKHQVAEVTSLGLVQMTRKRIGQGLLEAFSEPCEVCNGRGIKVHLEPVITHHDPSRASVDQVDKAERVARVAKIAKASRLGVADAGASQEPAGADSLPDGVGSVEDHDVPAPAAARTRSPRAPKAAAATTTAATAPEPAGAQPPPVDPAATPAPVARRRRVAKKAQGSPDPAP